MMRHTEKACLPEDNTVLSGPVPFTCLEIECVQCKQRWLLPVREEWTDWRLIAEEYRKRNQALESKLSDVWRERDALEKRLDATRQLLDALTLTLITNKKGVTADERG